MNVLSIQSHVAYGHVGNASAVFALVAVLSLARLAVSWRDAGQGGRAGAAAHATMAVGMAAMAVPAADPLPRWGG